MSSIPFTLGPAYNEFGYNGHPSTTSRFLWIELIGSNVTKFRFQQAPNYNEQCLLRPFTRCKRDPLSDHKHLLYSRTVQNWTVLFYGQWSKIWCDIVYKAGQQKFKILSWLRSHLHWASVSASSRCVFTHTKRRARTNSDADAQCECSLNKLIRHFDSKMKQKQLQ